MTNTIDWLDLADPVEEDGPAIAAAIGLRYVSDEAPGIRRRRCGKGWTFMGTDGIALTGAARQRCIDLVIPPAWTDVWIAPSPKAHLQVTGRDAAGRKQYLYHPEFRAEMERRKFDRIAGFGAALEVLRPAIRAHLEQPDDPVDHLVATALRLIDRTLIRVGDPLYTEQHGSIGATTLERKHVTVDKGRITLRFPGKSGVAQEITTFDPVLAEALEHYLPGRGRVFRPRRDRPGLTSELLNDRLRTLAGNFTAKDFRTWGGTSEAVAALAAQRNVEDPEAAIRDAIEVASERLGNTPTVCRASYVAPVVLDAYTSGELHDIWRATRRTKHLRRPERVAGRLLTDALVAASSL